MSSPTADPALGPEAFGAGDVQRRLDHLERWRRHSALVRFLRRALPALIGVMLIALLAWAGYSTFVLQANLPQQPAGMSIRVVNAKFFGRDQTGKPFSLSAAGAVRDDNMLQRIYLDRPAVVLGATPADQTHVTAKKGVYREDTQILLLDGDVRMIDPDGNQFLSQHALVDTLTRDVDGDAHIDGHGPLGRIAASSYAVRGGGAHVFFRGQVKAHIEQHGPAPSPAASAAGLSGSQVRRAQ